MQITDRSKDVIKSGGEWISSIDLENVAAGHPFVTMAACISVAHPKWDERPLLVVEKKVDLTITDEAIKADILKFFEGKIAKWWIPDDVVFVDKIPLTATGKMQKLKLREQFKNHQLPTL
jgi:fatty-acyl-CoA synthase